MTIYSPSASLPGEEERALSPGIPQDETKHFRSSQGQGGSMPVPHYRTFVLLNVFKRLVLGQGDMGEARSSLELHSKLSL